MYEIKVIRRMWNLYKILCAPLFRMGRSLALLQRICKASNSGYVFVKPWVQLRGRKYQIVLDYRLGGKDKR